MYVLFVCFLGLKVGLSVMGSGCLSLGLLASGLRCSVQGVV